MRGQKLMSDFTKKIKTAYHGTKVRPDVFWIWITMVLMIIGGYLVGGG